MGLMMSSDSVFRAVVKYDYFEVSTGQTRIMESIHGPYDTKSMAKQQGKNFAKRSAHWYKTGTNHRFTVERCDGWTELEEHYV
jgi:hypothetical protein